MKMTVTVFLILCISAVASPSAAQEGDAHRSAPIGSYGGAMNPDVSAVVDLRALFTDDEENTERGRARIDEAEIAFSAFLYPSISGDFIVAMHEHEGEWHVHPEEAYVSFLELPGGLQLIAGRKLIEFGRVNPVHPHHWRFATPPLVMSDFFGDHPLFDDGAQVDWLLPNPWDLYCRLAFGHWAGGSADHDHGEEEEHAESIEWRGRIYNGRAVVDLPFGELSDVLAGYSIIWDEGYHTMLHGGDLTLTWRRPMSYTRVVWQSEVWYAATKDESVSDPLGFFSTVSLTLDTHWELGARYDLSEYLAGGHEEEEDHATPTLDDDRGITGFVSYYFMHSLYLRLEYARLRDRYDTIENRGTVQLVWGLGPHAHRLED
jgi:hypothetical protein